MRLGDYIVCGSVFLNLLATLCYAYQKHWPQAYYFFAALQINMAILFTR